MTHPTVGAVILATADTGFGEASRPGGPVSSLVEIAGEPLVARVVRAARGASSIGPIAVVCASDPSLHADAEIASGGDLAADIRGGLQALDGCAYALLLPGDILFATDAEIQAFLDAAFAREVEMAYPMVPRGVCEARFPDFRRTYHRLEEGELTGGNALLVHVPTFLREGDIISEAVALRREPWRLALQVDPLILFSYTAGRLSTTHIEEAVRKALGIRAAALVLDVPGLATDIQKPIDVKAARERLE